MAITKIVYVDGVTVIRAAQLNAWQDEMIRLDDVKYEKPADGIPKSDLAAALQTLLDKAQDVEEAAERGDFDGEDGVSPTITVEEITGGHRVTITSKAHPEGQTFDVLDGEDGEDGSPGTPGAPGVSPTVTVENITGGHRITITDATGTETFDVMDGEDGGPGATPDLQIGEVTAGAPGSAAAATITGTPEEPRLNLMLPRGQQGPSVPLSDATPLMDGTASPGTGTSAARSNHRHPTDTTRAAAAELATYVRPNLLVNWYFVGGGSQLGYGVFPINQRGQTSYQTVGNAIDRWYINNALTMELQSEGLQSSTSSVATIQQPISAASLRGRRLTAAALCYSVSGSFHINIRINGTVQFSSPDITSAGITSLAFTVPTDANTITFEPRLAASTSVIITAVKLEIGDTQTLAHQENGAWVLNEVPDYAEQLAKCQAYYIRFSNYTAPGYITTGSTSYRMKITLPVSMARIPTPTISSYVCRVVTGDYSEHTGAYPGVAPTALSIDPNYGTNNFSIQDLLSAASTDLNNAPCIFEIYGLQLSAE